MNRRDFVSALGGLPLAANAALTAQAEPAAEAARLRTAAGARCPAGPLQAGRVTLRRRWRDHRRGEPSVAGDGGGGP
jgi:hypothetical protein